MPVTAGRPGHNPCYRFLLGSCPSQFGLGGCGGATHVVDGFEAGARDSRPVHVEPGDVVLRPPVQRHFTQDLAQQAGKSAYTHMHACRHELTYIPERTSEPAHRQTDE